LSQVFNRSYRLSVIEQKTDVVSRPKISQQFSGINSTGDISEGILNFPDLEEGILQTGNLEDNILNTNRTYGGDSVMITSLHMTARINSKSSSGETSDSVIQIFNASPETRAKLEKKNAYIILEAGYGDDFGIVFTGTSQRAFTERNGTEMITEIQCVDSNIPIRTTRVSFSWPTNTKYSDIFDQVANEMKKQGISIGMVETTAKNLPSLPSPAETIAKGGYSFQGLASQLLDKLCEQFNYTWYITLNELYIHPRTFNNFTVQYDMSSNLIKSLRPDQSSRQEVPTVETPQKFKLITFLDHRIKVGQRVNITDGGYKGTYKVISVNTSLSYLDGGSWDSDIELEVVG
jgi:hypothetical protein